MASPTSSLPVDAPVAAEPSGRDAQREFLRLALGHAHWFARWFGAEGEEAARWLDDGLSNYPLALGEAMPPRRPQLFWRAMLGAELPGSGRMVADDERHLIEELLAELDPAARAAFLLRVWHDFDDDLLADLLGLRVGQVRVGLMRAFGRMRARLDVGGDGIADARLWLQLFRARLATLTARLDIGARTQNRQRLSRLFDPPEPPAAPAPEVAPTFETAAVLRETSLADVEIIRDADFPELCSAEFSSTDFNNVTFRTTAPAAKPRDGTGFGRLPTAVRWAVPGMALLLMVLGFWQFGQKAEPVVEPAPLPTATSAAAPAQAIAEPIPAREVEAVLASPDLPLLAGRLAPNQLAVMDQLRWWASNQPPAAAQEPTAVSTAGSGEAPSEAPADFEQLTSPDRRLLRGFAGLWPRLGDEQRLILLDNAQRWRAMGTTERERVIQRSQSFGELPAPSRTRARDSFALWQSLPPGEQASLVAAFAAFSALTPEQQRAVADGFVRLSPSDQARWRFAEGERELLALAGRVFSFVPEAERSETLALLQALDEADRDRLRNGTRRMSAWQREQLRKTLLAEAEENRSDWLRRRFGG